MHPPKRALKFLRWFCRQDYIEELEGDLTEVFEKQYEQSPLKAKWQFCWTVIRYFRPEFIKSFKINYHLNTSAMFRHNFLLTYRTFKRYKTSFFINLIGLSTGLACALLIYLWVLDELQVDKFHEKDDQLFLVMGNQHYSDGIFTAATTPGLLAETLAEEMPEIEFATAVSSTNTYNLSLGDTYIKGMGIHASQDYFNTFSYQLIQGNKDQVLANKNSIVLSKTLATTLFLAPENSIGKTVSFQNHQQYQVSGVFEDTPANSSVQFDFVLSFEAYKTENPWVLEWGNNGTRTYLVLSKGTNPSHFNEKIDDFINNRTAGLDISLFLKPYADHYLYGNYKNGIQAGGRIAYVKLFSIIALFILVIACINFMNLSTAKASRRIKEVGIKKAIGAHRHSLIFQFLEEALTMVFIAEITAIVLVALFLPQFNYLTGKQLSLQFAPYLIYSFLVIALLAGLVAGSYPAMYLSNFNPATMLRGGRSGTVSTSVGELLVRKGLVVFQFTISVILIVAVVVVYKQITFIQTKNLGYNKDNILHFEIEGKVKEKQETFLSEIKRLPGIVNASSMAHSMVEGGNTTGGIRWEGKSPDDLIPFEFINVNYDMIETLGIEMAAGRAFSSNFISDSTKIIFNEAAIDLMGLSDPIGKVVNLWGKDRQIIGVAKNFHFASLHETVKPLLFRLAPEKSTRIIAKIEAGKEKETISALQKFYHQYNAGFPFDYQFLDDDYQRLYASEQRVSTLSKYFAGMAILISCLGLFGLAAFTAERRLKEIGIRKILGSTDWSIVYLLSSDFTKMVLVAIVIALPISYFIATKWLEGFAFKIDLEWWYFVGAGLVALLIAWFTVGLQTIKAARVNPTDCLKDE